MSFANFVELRGTDLDSIAGEVVDVCDLRGHSEEPVTWVLSRHASFVFCPSCRANAVFRQNFGNCFPTRFVVDQVGAHVFATVDWFLWQSCGYRDGQQVLWLDVEGLCLPRKVDVQQVGLCKGPGNVPDGGLACFDINTMVVDGTVWLSQLFEHRVDELVEEL